MITVFLKTHRLVIDIIIINITITQSNHAGVSF